MDTTKVFNPLSVFKLRGAALNVYVALCYCANGKMRCWPTYGRLSELTGYSKRECSRGISKLVELGLVAREVRKADDGGIISNIYTLIILPE